jgi:hypothetical protein
MSLPAVIASFPKSGMDMATVKEFVEFLLDHAVHAMPEDARLRKEK